MSKQEEELKDTILLVFANKQDAKGALKAPKISELLGLDEIRRRQWTIMETSAKKGEGLTEGFDWWVFLACDDIGNPHLTQSHFALVTHRLVNAIQATKGSTTSAPATK
jgi:hypothetical protein